MKLPYKVWRKQTGSIFGIAEFLSAEDAREYFDALRTYPVEDITYILKRNGREIERKGAK